jgi:NAD+ synthase
MPRPPGHALGLDPVAATDRIAATLRRQLGELLDRRGLVVAMSGGIDSSVCAGLAVRAVGPKRVFGLFLPERESDPQSLVLARDWAAELGIDSAVEDIAPILEASGCYRRRDEAIRRVIPEYTSAWRSKVVLGVDRLASDRLNVSYLAVQPPSLHAELRHVRLPAAEYRQIVAATNFKQRVRKMLEYYHADRLHYAVIGTPNRLEYDQGFFVKGGDGLADVKPIAHLYKTQVYQLAEHLGVPAAIRSRVPTTDTYSLPQTQEEFYFSLPARTLDIVLHARDAERGAAELAAELGYRPEQIERAFTDIDRKRRAAEYLHQGPLLVEPVSPTRDHA